MRKKRDSLDYQGVRKIGVRLFATWIINALALALMAHLLSSFQLGSFQQALVIAAILGLLNALVWPLLMRFTLSITVLTLGLGSLFINGIFVVIATSAVQKEGGVYIKDWQTGVLVAIGVTAINALLTELFAINDDDFYYRHVISRLAKHKQYRNRDSKEKTGVIFLEIDGLAHDILIRAFNDGTAPNMGRWLRDGSHHLEAWECDWSSQTGAMQAGILLGSNWDMPLFRWWEKDKNKHIVCNTPKDAAEIERRHSNGEGLLHYDGASRGNLLSGDAPHSMLTTSTALKHDRVGGLGQDYMAFFANPYNLLRTLLMIFGEIFKEYWQQVRQRRRNIQPRVRRGLFPYPFLRAFTNVIQRELNMSALIQDICAGRPVIYAMFLGYDEVAHHSGTERPETLAELEQIDREFARLEKALDFALRPYQIVVLSDHGQSQGATFLQRYDESLKDLVDRLTDSNTGSKGQGEEAWGELSSMLTEITKMGGTLSRLTQIATRSKKKEAVEYGQRRDETGRKHKTDEEENDVLVMPSGNLAGVYFTSEPGRLTLEQIETEHPRLIKGLKRHPGVGFLLVKSSKHGPMVIGKDGTLFLDSGKLEGKNPLANFGPNAAQHIARTSSFPHCPDIMVNSTYWPETGEVAAFEELVGSHGGMGGTQQYPFILFPENFRQPHKPISGAENVHRQFRNWLAALGWESYEGEFTPRKGKV